MSLKTAPFVKNRRSKPSKQHERGSERWRVVASEHGG